MWRRLGVDRLSGNVQNLSRESAVIGGVCLLDDHGSQSSIEAEIASLSQRLAEINERLQQLANLDPRTFSAEVSELLALKESTGWRLLDLRVSLIDESDGPAILERVRESIRKDDAAFNSISDRPSSALSEAATKAFLFSMLASAVGAVVTLVSYAAAYDAVSNPDTSILFGDRPTSAKYIVLWPAFVVGVLAFSAGIAALISERQASVGSMVLGSLAAIFLVASGAAMLAVRS